jgi:hypothetical protein
VYQSVEKPVSVTKSEMRSVVKSAAKVSKVESTSPKSTRKTPARESARRQSVKKIVTPTPASKVSFSTKLIHLQVVQEETKERATSPPKATAKASVKKDTRKSAQKVEVPDAIMQEERGRSERRTSVKKAKAPTPQV